MNGSSWYASSMLGFLNINKPPGPTSHDIVARVRRLVPRGVSVGHAGTLDPFASGVLVVCVGGACRLASLVMGQDKKYVTTIRLGASSDTDDRTGTVTPLPDAITPNEPRVLEILRTFVGDLAQVPPSHSAALVEGRRAYKIARAGVQVTLAPKMVRIDRIDLLEYTWPLLKLEIGCGCGTYIRALARDIGKALGVGGYCTELTRTASGAFTIELAASPGNVDVNRDLISALVAVQHLSKFQLTQEQVKQVLLGRKIAAEPPLPEGDVAMVDAKGELLALGIVLPGGTSIQPNKVLVNTHAMGINRDGPYFISE
jgi:tRNA pseudouridine55 synthase